MARLPEIKDYSDSISYPQLIRANKLIGGQPKMTKNGKPIQYVGGFCVVFRYGVLDKEYAVRCWYVEVNDAKERIRLIAQSLKQLNLPYFVGFEYIDDAILTKEGLQPIVLMDWVNAKPLKKYIGEHLREKDVISNLADEFAKMIADLHQHNISHGDLQHGNIMVKDSGEIVLVDYDSMYLPALNGWNDCIKGLPDYQHPARTKNEKLTPKADYFSEMVIYTAIKALSIDYRLWYDYKIEGTETMLFTKDDFDAPEKSGLFARLSKMSELTDLIQNMKSALRCTFIDEILPLEIKTTNDIDDLREKWKKRKEPIARKPVEPYSYQDVLDISKKWKKH